MDGFEAFEHLFVGTRSAGHRPARPGARDDRLPRRAATGRWRRPCGTSSARSPACRSRRCSAAPTDGLPVYASCGMLLPPAARAESALRLRDEGFKALKIRIDPRALDRGARGRGRDARRGRRLDGDHGRPQPGLADGRRLVPLARPQGGPGDRGATRRVRRPVAGGAARRDRPARPGRAARVDAGGAHRRWRDDPDLHRAAGRARGRRLRRPPAGRRPGRRDVARPDLRRARPRPEPLVQPAHLDQRDRPARQPPRRGRRRWRPVPRVSRTTRPAGPPNVATSCSPSRSARAPTGSSTSRPRPASASSSTRPPSSATPHDDRRARHDRRLARARGRDRAADRAVHRRRSVPAASGRTFDDIAGRDGSRIATVAEGGVEDVDRAVAAARRSFDDRRWSDQPPAARKRVLLRLAELVREHLDELALLESLDVGKPIRDTLSVDIPSAATTLQWYAETIDKVYGEVGPTGPDALSLVTREPIGVVAAIVPWNYPMIITAWKLGAALATGQFGRPQARQPVAADRAPPRRAGRRGRAAGRRPQRRDRPGCGHRRRPRPPSGRRQDRVHRVDRGRPVAAPRGRRVGRQGDLARARRQEPAGRPRRRRRSRGRPPRRSAGGSSTTAARRATPGRGSSSIARSARSSSSGSPRSGGSSRRASRSTRGRGSARSSTTDSSRRSSATWTSAARRAPGRVRRRARPRGDRRLLRRADDPRRRGQHDAGRARGDLRAGPDRAPSSTTRTRRSPSPTTRRTAWPPACGPATSTGPTGSRAGSGPGSSRSTRSTRRTSRSRSAATSSRGSGATRASTRSTATPSSRRPGSTCRAAEPRGRVPADRGPGVHSPFDDVERSATGSRGDGHD